MQTEIGADFYMKTTKWFLFVAITFKENANIDLAAGIYIPKMLLSQQQRKAMINVILN